MDPFASNAQPSNTGRVQLPSIKNLVDTLPPPSSYRALSSQSTWVSPFPSTGLDASGVQSNGPPRSNRLPSFPPALRTPPPRYLPAESPYTATASPSVVFSSASSGTSEPSMGRPPYSSAPPTRSMPDVSMRTAQDTRTNSPISSAATAIPEAYRPTRPAHSLVSQIPSMHQQLQQPHGANLGSRLSKHSSGGATSTPAPTSTATAIHTRLNMAPALNQDRGGKHCQDPRVLPPASDRQSHRSRAFSPSSLAGHHSHQFISPTSERPLPPRSDAEYMHRQQHHHQPEDGRRGDQRQIPSRSESQSQGDQHPPPTPPWEHQSYQATHRSSSMRGLDPGDVRSRSTKYSDGAQSWNDSPAYVTPGAARHSYRASEHSAPYSPGEQDIGDDRRENSAGTGQGYGLRPARWTESGTLYHSEEMDPRRPEFASQPLANMATSRQNSIQHTIASEGDHGILATRSDRRYPPILPAPFQSQRQYTGAEKPTTRPGPVVVRNRRQGLDTALHASQDSMHRVSPKHIPPTTSSTHFHLSPAVRPPLPKGLIRRRSKDDLGRALQELTNEANRAMAEGKAMKKIHEFSRVVQQFSAHYARYPGPPSPSPEDVEEMSHRAVLIYRMAQAIKAKILSKKATAGNIPQAASTLPLPSRTRVQKKKKVITKEEKQVLDDMERIRRKRTAAQQGIKSKYMKRNKKTIAPKQCASCHTKETPEWRKGPDGPRSLCNACGLHWAKLQRKRKEDGQWIGEGAPPPIDIIMLRQVTGVGLQPRFNERGEFEIPGTYKNIPASKSSLSAISRWKVPSTRTAGPEVLMADPPTNDGPTATDHSTNEQTSGLTVPSETDNLPPDSAVSSAQGSGVNHIAIDRLSTGDPALSQPQPQQSSPILIPTEHEGRARKRKASRDHGDRDIDEDETAAPSLKRRRALSPQHVASNVVKGSIPETAQPLSPLEETIWQRAF